MKNTLSLRPIRIGLLFIFLIIADNIIHAENIPLRGHWKDTRSISHEVPISADLTGCVLTIQIPAMSSDIVVTIVKEENNVFTRSIPATDAAEIQITVDVLESGTYLLEIRSLLGGHLYGNFIK